MQLEELQIELAGVCNARCHYCTWEQRSVGKQFMDTELALSLVRQAAELKVGLVTFHGLGESTLHPDLVPILEEAGRLGLRTRLSSNCRKLHGQLAQELASMPHLDMILAIHWGLHLTFLYWCVRNAVDYLGLPNENRSVEVLMVCGEGEEAIWMEHFRTVFLPLVEALPRRNGRLHYKQPLTWPSSPPVKGCIPDFPEHPLVEIERLATPRSIGAGCRMPEYLLQVMADGTTAPCCVAIEDWGLPKVQEAGLAGVWASARMVELRRLWHKADDSVPCGHCKKRKDCVA